MSQQATQYWPCDRRSVAGVRQFVEEHCRRWHLDAVTDDLVLIASEIATNAVTHARSSITLKLSLIDGQVRLEISDNNSQMLPRPAPPWRTTTLSGADAAHIDNVDFLLGDPLDQEDVSERGLMIIAALAASWGTASENSAPGKTVWATCPG